MKDVPSRLIEELLQHFVSEKYTIVGAKALQDTLLLRHFTMTGTATRKTSGPMSWPSTKFKKRFVIGVVKADKDDLESPHSLTQYDVFFDHKNAQERKTVAGLLSSSAGFRSPNSLRSSLTTSIAITGTT